MSRFSYDKNNDQLTLISGSYKNMIAKEESSPTSKGYSVGDHFIYNGILYKVTAPIGSGVTGGAIVTSGINANVILADTVESRIDSINEALSNLTTDVAPIENGTNYSTSYSKGDQFIRNGLLYKVTAATVSSSTAINTGSGGNATFADCLTKQLADVNEALSDEVEVRGVLGAKNVLKLKFSNIKAINKSGTWDGYVYTLNGGTFTVTVDDADNVTNIVADGTFSAQTIFALTRKSSDVHVPFTDNFKINGIAGGSSITYQLAFNYWPSASGSENPLETLYDGEKEVYIDKNWILGGYFVISTGTVSNVSIKPMIRPASDTDPTYQPYAMTNRELMENKADKSDLASISITGTTNNTGATIASGTFFYLNGSLVRAKISIANGATLTLDTNYESVTAGGLNALNANISMSSWNNMAIGGYCKSNKFVELNINKALTNPVTVSAWTTSDILATISGYSNDYTAYVPFLFLTTGNVRKVGMIIVGTTGNIQIFNNSGEAITVMDMYAYALLRTNS